MLKSGTVGGLTLLTAFSMLSPLAFGANALFSYKGKTYKTHDIPTAYQQALYDAQYESYLKEKAIVDAAVLDTYFAEEAKKQGKTKEQVEEHELAVDTPSDKDLKTFYDQNKERIPYPFDQIKEELRTHLKQEKQREKREAMLADLQAKHAYKYLLEAPQAPVVKLNTDGFAWKGNDKAKVTIVEFADYQCPHCRAAEGDMAKVLDKYGKEVKYVFADFPINPSGISTVVAQGAVCAKDQGKYWEYHKLAYEEQTKLTKDSPADLAKQLGLDQAKFKACMATAKPAEVVNKGKEEGNRVGVGGTPTIFVNGKRVATHAFADVSAAIDSALKAR